MSISINFIRKLEFKMTIFDLSDVSNEEFNKQFWNRLQDEWKKISDGLDEQSPWLAEFSEYYDPYTVKKKTVTSASSR